MNKKMTYIISIVLICFMQSLTFSIQLGDFENNMDGWRVIDDVNVVTSYSTTGATLNQSSLRISVNSGNINAIAYDLIEQGLVDEFRNNLKVSADITRLVSEWTDIGGSWCDFSLAVNAGSSVPGSEWEYFEELDGNADWWIELGDEPMSETYDYSLALNQIDFNNLEYLEFVFVTNWGGFDPGGVYYLDNVQMFGGGPAYDPVPANGARDVTTETILSWTSGAYADKHDVYFGTNLNDVNNANRTNPLNVLLSQDYDLNTFDPGKLSYGENYFWRIDEVNGPDIWKGKVWSFTTAYPSSGYVLGDWEDNMDNWVIYPGSDTLLSYSTTGATLNNKSLKLEVTSSYWFFRLNLNAEQLEALKANDILKIDVTWVASEWVGHTWSQVHKVSFNSSATGWREMNSPVSDTSNPASPGSCDPSAAEIDTRTLAWDYSDIDVNSIEEGGWTQINISQNHDSSAGIGTYYFDNARLINSKLASEPYPASMQKEVPRDEHLSWNPGTTAVTHDLYFGISFDDVSNVTRDDLASYPSVIYKNLAVNTFNPGILELGRTYFWRIDEVNEPEIWKGDVWSFTVGEFLVVDDFDDYNNYEPYRIFDTWKDGWGTTTNGALVGYEDTPFAEQNIVHGGSQSMPYTFDNNLMYSEATITLIDQRDWTAEDVKRFSLWFRGYPGVLGSFVEAPSGTYTIIGSGEDIWGQSDEFHFAYKTLTGPGSIVAKVESIGNTNPWAKAGVMIRDTLQPGSKHAFACITPGNGVASQGRIDTNSDSFNVNQSGISAPYWLKLERNISGRFTVFHSADGSTWNQVENATATHIQMQTTVLIGLAVTANSAGAKCEAKFSDVSFTGTVGAQWANQDIGIPSNDPEPMYISIANANGTTGTVYHNNQNATQIDTWTQWIINLQDFADQGVNLTDINSISIGFGDKNNIKAGGKGKMYFDDIRLLRDQTGNK